MLSKPDAGWTDVTMELFSGRASYVTDVPIDFLDAFINLYETGNGIITCDEEGSEFIIILSGYCYVTYVIADREELSLYRIETKIKDLANELIADISKHLDEWVKWLPNTDEDMNENDIKERRRLILSKIMKLKSLVEKKL